MNTNKSIEELLKESFNDFSPEAPDVWGNISQGLTQAGAQTGATVGTAAKTITLAAKVWIGTTLVALVSGGLIWYANQEKNTVTDSPVIESINRVQTNENQISNELQNQSSASDQQVKIESNQPIPKKLLSTSNESERTSTKSQSASTSGSDNSILKPSQRETQPTNQVVSTVSKTTDKTEGSTVQQPVKNEIRKSGSSVPQTTLVLPEPEIPNIFTPGNDGLNDQFIVEIEQAESYAIKIINLKGSIVYESNNLHEHWTGLNRNTGEPCEAGWYFYTVKYQQTGGEPQVKNGKVKLVR